MRASAGRSRTGSLVAQFTGRCSTMRTPGRCTNTEGCWISASHRSVWLSVGEDFVCPNCGGNLSAPLPQTRSFRAVKRAAAFGAIASVSLTVAALGMVKLSTVSWPGQSVAARVVQAPAALLKATFSPKATPVEVAEVPLPVKPPTTRIMTGRRTSQIHAPTVPFGMVLASGRGPHTPQAAHPVRCCSTRRRLRSLRDLRHSQSVWTNSAQ